MGYELRVIAAKLKKIADIAKFLEYQKDINKNRLHIDAAPEVNESSKNHGFSAPTIIIKKNVLLLIFGYILETCFPVYSVIRYAIRMPCIANKKSD